ncbi:hypothetical protein Tco_0554388 [Tanacetum coccineum]
MLLFMHFRILGQSLDEGSLPLMSEEDVIRLLEYVPRFREVEGKAVLIEKIRDHDVKDAVEKELDADSGNSSKIPLKLEEVLYYATYDSASISGKSRDVPTWFSDEDVDQGIDVEWKADPYHNVDELEEPEEISDMFVDLDQALDELYQVVAEEMVTEETVDGDDGDVIPTEVYDAMVSQEQLEDQDGDVIPVKVVAKDKVVEEIVEVVTEVYDAMVAQEMLEYQN